MLKLVNQDKFNEFWNEYPRKVAKKRAKQIFESLDDSLFEEILLGVRKYKKWIDMNGIEPQFILHPSTYLYQERWTDEFDVQTIEERIDAKIRNIR